MSSCSGRSNEVVAPTRMPAPTEFTFEQYEVETSTAKHQTVLTGFLLGGPTADVAVVNVDENGNRHLCIHAFSDDTWVMRLNTTLRPEVLFIDVVNIGGRDRLITYEQGRLNWFDPESVTERALVEISTNYNAPAEGGIPYVDISRDVNRDTLDDLIVPDLDGFWIAMQLSSGLFTDPIKLGPPEPFLDEIALDDTRSYREVGITPLTVLWYLSRVHQMDYDQNGRSDLVFWNTIISTFIARTLAGCFPRWQRPSRLTSLSTLTVPTQSPLSSAARICSLSSSASERIQSGRYYTRSEI